jgi:hypothetical protein
VDHPRHEMELISRGEGESLFVCPVGSCGRRVVLSSRTGMTVLERGDFFAYHSGGAGISVTTSVTT